MTSRSTLLAFALVLVTATFASAAPMTILVEETPMVMDSKMSYLNAMRGNGFNNPTMMITRVQDPEGLRMVRMERMGMMPKMTNYGTPVRPVRFQRPADVRMYGYDGGGFGMRPLPPSMGIPMVTNPAPMMMHLAPSPSPQMRPIMMQENQP